MRELALRLEALGRDHALYPLAAGLRQAAEVSAQAGGAYRASVTAEKDAEAAEEIAQAALRLQYERCYLHAREKLGRDRAEQLFPPLRSGGSQAAAAPAEGQ